MLIWDITAPGHGGFSLTDRVAAERIRDILNSGTLYPGGAASLGVRRAPKMDEPRPVATLAQKDDGLSDETHGEIDQAVATVRSLNAKEAATFIMTLNDRAVLEAVHASERAHPKYEGGRHDVTNACEERLGEIDVADPTI